MTNNEPPWEQTRTRVDNRLDAVLLLPWLGDSGGVLDMAPATMAAVAVLIAARRPWTRHKS